MTPNLDKTRGLTSMHHCLYYSNIEINKHIVNSIEEKYINS